MTDRPPEYEVVVSLKLVTVLYPDELRTRIERAMTEFARRAAWSSCDLNVEITRARTTA